MELGERLYGKKVLLVEDDQWVRDSLRRYFAREKCALIAVETGEDAIEVIRGNVCDIIIADYRLPGMTGLEFLKKALAVNPRVKKILLTAFMDEPVISEAFRLGVHEFIEKPFATADLEEALARVLEEKIMVCRREQNDAG